MEQDNIELIVQSIREKEVPRRRNKENIKTVHNNKRKKVRPKKVREINIRHVPPAVSTTAGALPVSEIKREVEEQDTKNESPIPSIDFTLENELLTEQQCIVREPNASSTSTSSSQSIVVTDQLKIFTLLLQVNMFFFFY